MSELVSGGGSGREIRARGEGRRGLRECDQERVLEVLRETVGDRALGFVERLLELAHSEVEPDVVIGAFKDAMQCADPAIAARAAELFIKTFGLSPREYQERATGGPFEPDPGFVTAQLDALETYLPGGQADEDEPSLPFPNTATTNVLVPEDTDNNQD